MEPLTTSETFQPPAPSARNANIDAIRGLAVLGILFMNIYFFGNSFSGYANHETVPIHDTVIMLFSNFFLEGRFISLFSMLFGVGLAIQYNKLSALDGAAYQTMKSRLKWLLLFGVIHGIFIWYGDILFTYALGGFLALCYLKQDNKKLLKKSIIFITLPLFIFAIISFISPEEAIIRGSAQFEEDLSIWSGTYSGQLMMQLIIFTGMLFITPLTTMWLTAGLMLLGVVLYRKKVFEKGLTQRQLLQLLLATILLSALDSACTLATNPGLNTMSDSIVMLSAIPMALIYIHLLVKLCQNRATILAPLQKVGRLAFSLYILQSVCGVLLFRHIEPTLMTTLDRPGYMLIAIGFSLFQVILASVYLKYFNQGPLEWVWRRLATRKLTATATQTTPIASADT